MFQKLLYTYKNLLTKYKNLRKRFLVENSYFYSLCFRLEEQAIPFEALIFQILKSQWFAIGISFYLQAEEFPEPLFDSGPHLAS